MASESEFTVRIKADTAEFERQMADTRRRLHGGRSVASRLNRIEGLACWIFAWQFDLQSASWWIWLAMGFLALFGAWDSLARAAQRRRAPSSSRGEAT